MAKKKEVIKFVVVQHYSGNKTLKDLIENLIMREITDTSKKRLVQNREKITKRLKNQELRVIIIVTNNSL